MVCTPLRLTLTAVLPSRSARGFGYRLRLADGPALDDDDPILAAYGARVVALLVTEDHEEALQHDSFDPGRRLRLELGAFDPHDPDAVGVWDAEGVRQGGELPGGIDQIAAAALDHGLPMEALALWETRERVDDRRVALNVLVHSPRFVCVDGLGDLGYERPRTAGRPRLVLLADGSDDVRWWDPSMGAGPAAPADVPISQELANDFDRLREDYAALRDRSLVGVGDGFDLYGDRIERSELEERARELWRRARHEIGRRFAVGYLGQGMRRPVWAPDDLSSDDEDDDVAF